MRGRPGLVLLLLALPVALWAQTPADQACAPFSKLEIPEPDKPTPAQAVAAGAPCSPFDLYYGSNMPGRFAKARWCGLAVIGMLRSGVDPARVKAVQAAATGGATSPELGEADGLTLMMLYANGEGVARNPRVAQTLACQYAFESPQGDGEQMPVLLKSLASGRRFNLCGEDQGPQGRSVWFACAVMQAGKTAQQANSMESAVIHAAAPGERTAWSAVEKAWAQLSSARAASFGAQCAGGTGCGVMSAQDDLAMEESWLAKLKLARTGALPSGLPQASELASLDAELNSVYREQIADAGITATPGTQGTSDDLANLERTTERAWIRFRDAWVSYAAVHWQAVPADRWRAQLTAEWTRMLQEN